MRKISRSSSGIRPSSTTFSSTSRSGSKRADITHRRSSLSSRIVFNFQRYQRIPTIFHLNAVSHYISHPIYQYLASMGRETQTKPNHPSSQHNCHLQAVCQSNNWCATLRESTIKKQHDLKTSCRKT